MTYPGYVTEAVLPPLIVRWFENPKRNMLCFCTWLTLQNFISPLSHILLTYSSSLKWLSIIVLSRNLYCNLSKWKYYFSFFITSSSMQKVHLQQRLVHLQIFHAWQQFRFYSHWKKNLKIIFFLHVVRCCFFSLFYILNSRWLEGEQALPQCQGQLLLSKISPRQWFLFIWILSAWYPNKLINGSFTNWSAVDR